jgi:hypothetical protein
MSATAQTEQPQKGDTSTADSRSYPHPRLFRTNSVRGPKCPVPPWSRTVGESRAAARLFHFSEWICISQNFNEHREQLGRPMEPSSSAELTDKIMCCIRIGKAPPNNGATGTVPELTTLWWNAVPRVKFVYRVQLIQETARRYAHIYKVWEILPNSLPVLSAFVIVHLPQEAK